MPTSAHQVEAGAGLCFGFGLGKDTASHSHHRVACENEPWRSHGKRLLPAHAQGIGTRKFALVRGFVDIGRGNGIRTKAQSREQFAPPGRGRCQC